MSETPGIDWEPLVRKCPDCDLAVTAWVHATNPAVLDDVQIQHGDIHTLRVPTNHDPYWLSDVPGMGLDTRPVRRCG